MAMVVAASDAMFLRVRSCIGWESYVITNAEILRTENMSRIAWPKCAPRNIESVNVAKLWLRTAKGHATFISARRSTRPCM
eukprot:971421-Pleurochrysis_carterae.AAC.1